MALNIFGQPPEYLSGLLGIDPEKLRKQAFGTGLINTALAFAAQPRNQGYGSVLPYAARALMAGQQGAQGVYQGALQDYMTRQKIEDIKRQQQQEQLRQGAISQFAIDNPNLATAAQAFPEAVIPQVALKSLEGKKRDVKEVGGNLIDISGETPTVIYESPKELKAAPTRDIQQGRTRITQELQPDGTWKEIARGSMDAPKQAEAVSYKVETDATGKVVYIPNKPGYAVLNQEGQPTTYTPKDATKPPTAEESKAAGFYGRMQLASQKMNSPVIGDDGKPMKNPDGTPVTLEQIAGKPAKFIGDTFLSDKNRKLYKQAAENWVRANLRKESGAVIGEEEMAAEVANYFPTAFDPPAVVAQKAEFRKAAEDAMALAAGKSLKKKSGASGGWSIEEVQ